MFNNLRELITSMPDEKACRDYLIKERWNGVVICPYCGLNEGKVYVIEGGKRFKCGHNKCYKKFSVTVGTIFEDSNIPLTKWFMALYILSAHKKGISIFQLAKDIGCTQKTGWFILHRIREMMRQKVATKLNNLVEVDETYIGGKISNKHVKVRKPAGRKRHERVELKNKAAVMGLLERNGELKLVTIDKTDKETLQGTVTQHVSNEAVVVTDGLLDYRSLKDSFKGHEAVVHDNDEFVRGIYHTNSIEGVFSLLKRGIIGIYHQVSPKHLSRYCDEFSYRYNSRDMKDKHRFVLSVQRIEGRLDYKTLTGKK